MMFGIIRAKVTVFRVLALVFSLLCTQYLGMQHRIEHADRQVGVQSVGLSHAESGKNDSNHSCTIFDAATLADTVGASLPCMPLVLVSYALVDWRLFPSWDASITHYFQSRAPPVLLVVN